jgi:3'(2'), 5'-bisphosphate nucleotidase
MGELQFARRVVRTTAELGRHIQDDMTAEALTKSDSSPVSVADFAIQAVIAHELQQEYPEDPLVGEEQAAPLQKEDAGETLDQVVSFTRSVLPDATPEEICDWIEQGTGDPADRYWTLDPVDGTKGFLRGDQYAIALSLIENGEVQLGVLGCPNLADAAREERNGPGSVLYAERDGGAWCEPVFNNGERQQLEVTDTEDPENGVAVRSYESDHTDEELMQELMEVLQIQKDAVPLDSQAKYAVLASGAVDMYFRLLSVENPAYRENIWDQSAGAIIVEEAGGKVTDLDGRPLDFSTGRKLTNNRGVLATNGHLHDRCLDAIAQVEEPAK